jgi:hypothetical protein
MHGRRMKVSREKRDLGEEVHSSLCNHEVHPELNERTHLTGQAARPHLLIMYVYNRNFSILIPSKRKFISVISIGAVLFLPLMEKL